MGRWRLASLGILFIASISAAGNPCAHGPCVAGTVVGIADGDTVTLLVDEAGTKRQQRVRLTDIDTPERAQPWGTRARQALADKVFRRQVQVASGGEDRYGRLLGRIYLDGRDINREMVREGHAWVYRRYSSDHALLQDEDAARVRRAGLWALPDANRVPPWEWRRGARKPNTSTADAGSGASRRVAAAPASPRQLALAPTLAASFTCGDKHTCREMTSCDEARFHQEKCGIARLDGDGDGTPCERLCRDDE